MSLPFRAREIAPRTRPTVMREETNDFNRRRSFAIDSAWHQLHNGRNVEAVIEDLQSTFEYPYSRAEAERVVDAAIGRLLADK